MKAVRLTLLAVAGFTAAIAAADAPVAVTLGPKSTL